MKSQLQLKLLGSAGLIGALLFGVFSLLHPPTFNPWNTLGTFEKVSHHSFWVLDHIFITIGISLWLLGIASSQEIISGSRIFKKIGSWLFILSLTIWIVILTFEIGIIPVLVDAIEHHSSNTLMTIWFVVFGFGLLAGYFAFIFTWFGILFYSLAMKKDTFPNWFRLSGIWVGLLGALGIIVGLINIDYVFPILALTSGPPFIWTIILLWMMITSSVASDSL